VSTRSISGLRCKIVIASLIVVSPGVTPSQQGARQGTPWSQRLCHCAGRGSLVCSAAGGDKLAAGDDRDADGWAAGLQATRSNNTLPISHDHRPLEWLLPTVE